MNTLSSSGIGAALSILFNLLYFVSIALLVSLLVERIWIGKSRWIILPVILLSVALLFLHPGLLLQTLREVTGSFSVRGLLSITGLGILAGMILSSL